jgi:sugar phosphate isomerase/epimerase
VATLEFTPYPPVGSLATGWEVVRLADRPNAKLLVDTWHIVRSGSDASLLREIPGDRIGAVQVSDGDAELTMPLMKATVGARRLPGEGDFDLATMLGALRDNGGLTCVGPEVMTVAWVGTSTVEVAQTAYTACERVGAW